jgi:hypothetical protein
MTKGRDVRVDVDANGDLQRRLSNLQAEHAELWRTITLSSEWQRMKHLEGRIDMLLELLNASNNVEVNNGSDNA